MTSEIRRGYRALNGVDFVIHAAALKQVPKAEEDPDEFIKTNITGAQNLIQSSIESELKELVSTDKAASAKELTYTEPLNFVLINYLLQQII